MGAVAHSERSPLLNSPATVIQTAISLRCLSTTLKLAHIHVINFFSRRLANTAQLCAIGHSSWWPIWICVRSFLHCNLMEIPHIRCVITPDVKALVIATQWTARTLTLRACFRPFCIHFLLHLRCRCNYFGGGPLL